MLLSLFLLSNSFVTVIVDTNETSNLSKDKTDHYKKVKQKKKQSEINWIKLNKTKIHLKQVLSQYGSKSKPENI